MVKLRVNIEAILIDRGISKVWLASKLGISKQSLNYAIKHSNSSKHLEAIYKILEKL